MRLIPLFIASSWMFRVREFKVARFNARFAPFNINKAINGFCGIGDIVGVELRAFYVTDHVNFFIIMILMLTARSGIWCKGQYKARLFARGRVFVRPWTMTLRVVEVVAICGD